MKIEKFNESEKVTPVVYQFSVMNGLTEYYTCKSEAINAANKHLKSYPKEDVIVDMLRWDDIEQEYISHLVETTEAIY